MRRVKEDLVSKKNETFKDIEDTVVKQESSDFIDKILSEDK